jgi:hypothetical protein
MKHNFFKNILFLFLIVSSSNYVFGQGLLLSKNAKVSLITCETGNESYSLFGHTAIRITDLENNLDVAYNYGAFDFSTPNFVAKFSKGDLQYFVIAHSFSEFLAQYSYERRSIYEQELQIPMTYKQKLFDNLNTLVSSDQRFYTYKFIDKNCTSMVVDILNTTLGYPVIVKKFDTDQTFRSILYPYFDDFFYEKLGTSIIFGTKVDQYGTRIFLPLELHKNIKAIQFKNQPLCKSSITLLNFEKTKNTSWWNNYYSFYIFLAFIVFLNRRKLDVFYLFTLGLLGLFFGFMGFYSFHQELTNNYNILLFNPLILILLYFQITKTKKWIMYLSYFILLLLIVYVLLMLNKIHLLLVLPLILTNGILLIRIILKNGKHKPAIS